MEMKGASPPENKIKLPLQFSTPECRQALPLTRHREVIFKKINEVSFHNATKNQIFTSLTQYVFVYFLSDESHWF